MADENTSKRGRKPRVTTEEILDVVRETLREHEAPVVVAHDVEPHLSIGLRATQKRLTSLSDDESTPLQSYDTGRAHVYWINDEDTERNDT